ncbi:hypothetical protein JZY06_01095 [Corynebacterium sp. CCM 8862]|uniref:Uncharacterized protein n=1 Tax=Corynebacterium mendelii TaxID=2765362 RepID=A0A939ISX4_9CORY|nr:hypothetical protein [Corynebacterium mendelii]MBN9643234.1 hypothetical protein [Corynebacterium mendelii]
MIARRHVFSRALASGTAAAVLVLGAPAAADGTTIPTPVQATPETFAAPAAGDTASLATITAPVWNEIGSDVSDVIGVFSRAPVIQPGTVDQPARFLLDTPELFIRDRHLVDQSTGNALRVWLNEGDTLVASALLASMLHNEPELNYSADQPFLRLIATTDTVPPTRATSIVLTEYRHSVEPDADAEPGILSVQMQAEKSGYYGLGLEWFGRFDRELPAPRPVVMSVAAYSSVSGSQQVPARKFGEEEFTDRFNRQRQMPPQQVTGSPDPLTPAVIEPGRISSAIVPGQTLYYSVPADYGQSVGVRIEAAAAAGEPVKMLSAAVADPLWQFSRDNWSRQVGDRSVSGPVDGGIWTMPYSISPKTRMPGSQLVAIRLGRNPAEGQLPSADPQPVAFEFSVAVVGQPIEARVIYQPVGEPADTPPADEPDTADEPSAPVQPKLRPDLPLLLTGLVFLAAVAIVLVRTRRKHPQPAPVVADDDGRWEKTLPDSVVTWRRLTDDDGSTVGDSSNTSKP